MRAETHRRNRGLGRTELVRHDELADPRFDGVGRLMANHARATAAAFVLLDSAGRIMTYVRRRRTSICVRTSTGKWA